MAKRNSYIFKLQATVKENMRIAQYTNERQCLDALIIALNEEFGFGKDRINRLLDAYIKARYEIADLFMDDRYVNKDKELNYAKEKSDRAFRQIMGEQYPSFEKRYHFDIGKPMYEGGLVVR